MLRTDQRVYDLNDDLFVLIHTSLRHFTIALSRRGIGEVRQESNQRVYTVSHEIEVHPLRVSIEVDLVLHALLTLVDEFSLLSAMLSSQTIPCPLSFLKVLSRS